MEVTDATRVVLRTLYQDINTCLAADTELGENRQQIVDIMYRLDALTSLAYLPNNSHQGTTYFTRNSMALTLGYVYVVYTAEPWGLDAAVEALTLLDAMDSPPEDLWNLAFIVFYLNMYVAANPGVSISTREQRIALMHEANWWLAGEEAT